MAERGGDEPRPQLTAIVFDVGHVLYDWDPRYLYSKLIDDPERLDWFLREVVTFAWHAQHDAGRDFAETSRELISRYPDEAALIEAYGPRWLETIPGPIPGMLELVRELDEAGLPLYAITNFSHEFFVRFRAQAPVFDRFRGVIVSGEEKCVKPEARIFEIAIERFGLEPRTTLFIDDRADNVATAARLGFQTHRFVDEPALRRTLERMGVLAPAQLSS